MEKHRFSITLSVLDTLTDDNILFYRYCEFRINTPYAYIVQCERGDKGGKRVAKGKKPTPPPFREILRRMP